jgi:hypothetical protein
VTFSDAEHRLKNSLVAAHYHFKQLQLRHQEVESILDLSKIKSADINLSLLRLERDTNNIFGVLIVDGNLFCITAEHPHNMLPSGVYELKKERNEKGFYKFQNTAISAGIISGNIATEDSGNGNILVDTLENGNKAVMCSIETFDRFMFLLAGRNAMLLIYDLITIVV